MARMAYQTSKLQNYDHTTGQFIINKFGNMNQIGTSSWAPSTSSSSSSGTNSWMQDWLDSKSYKVSISNNAQQALQKEQAALQKKKDAISDMQTSTTALQDSAVAMSQNDYSNADGTVQNLRSFIESYNKNLSTASKSANVVNVGMEMKVDMQQARFRSRFYGSIGINVSESGALSLDEEKLRTALATDKDKVGNMIGGSSGLVAKTAAITDEYLGTTTTLSTYRAGTNDNVTGTTGTTGTTSTNASGTANGYEAALISSLTALNDSTNTLWQADLEQSDDDAIVDAVKQFASDYTGVVNTLQSYKNDYYSAESIGLDFAEPRFKSKMYAAIGLNVKNNGSMAVNENAMRDALTNNRDRVIELLQGDNGLLSKTGNLIGSIVS